MCHLFFNKVHLVVLSLSTRAPHPMRARDTWACNSVLCLQHPKTQAVFDEWMNECNRTRAPSWPEALEKLLPIPSFCLLLLLTSSHAKIRASKLSFGSPGLHSCHCVLVCLPFSFSLLLSSSPQDLSDPAGPHSSSNSNHFPPAMQTVLCFSGEVAQAVSQW